MMITFYIFFAFVTYWAWIMIHELSHILMASKLLNVKEWKIIPYPHIDKGSFFFARAIWKYIGKNTPKKRAAISLAPRLPNIIAALMLQIAWFLPNPAQLFWIIFWIGGIVDLIYGSIGYSKRSDLQKASKQLKLNPWVLRIIGFTLALIAALPILLSKITQLL